MHQHTTSITAVRRLGARTQRARLAAAVLGLPLALAACAVAGDNGSSGGSGSAGGSDAAGSGSTASSSPAAVKEVVLATHDTWRVPGAVVKAFERRTGYRLEVLRSGDAGQLTNKLVLTEGNPVADAVYGIDNTFASRAVDAGVLAEHTPEDLPSSAERFALPDQDAASPDVLTPIDWGDVCVNVDDVWFAEHDLTPPRTLDDLADPAYRDLFVTPAASTSSPGFAFLAATVGEYGEDGWADYWQQLVDNGVRLTSGWTDAYEVDFSGGPGHGDRPIVLSYSSSPPFTIADGARRPTTSSLPETCFRQVEYAGVLAGARNPDGAAALVDFLTGRRFQRALPESMYVYPADTTTPLPPLWAKFAPPADQPIEVDPATITEHRDEWLREWSDVTSR